MIQKVSIYYFPYTFKSNSEGEAPIYCKITVNGKNKRFVTGISISPKQWDAPKQKVKGKNLHVKVAEFREFLTCAKRRNPCKRLIYRGLL